MNANKGVFGVNLGHMWGEIDRQRQWADQLLNLWTQGAIKPKVARTFPIARAGTPDGKGLVGPHTFGLAMIVMGLLTLLLAKAFGIRRCAL